MRARSLEFTGKRYREYPYPHLLRAIEGSMEMLAQYTIPGLREQYLGFAVFLKDTPLAARVLHALWQKCNVA